MLVPKVVIATAVLLVCSASAQAKWRVAEIPSSRVLVIERSSALDGELVVGERIIFLDDKGKAQGVGHVVEAPDGEPAQATCSVDVHERNGLVRIGDQIERFTSQVDGVDARIDLTWSAEDRGPAKARRTTYLGLLGGHLHALEAGEYIIDPLFNLEVGIVDGLSLSTMPIHTLGGRFNAMAKWNVLDRQYLTMTVSGSIARDIANSEAARYGGNTALGGSLVASFPTNTKLASHLPVNLNAKRRGVEDPDAGIEDSATSLSTFTATSSIDSITEYIFDNWNRAVVIPFYNLDTNAVGLTASHVWIWNRFHLGIGFRSTNVLSAKLSFTNGYVPALSLFWRH